MATPVVTTVSPNVGSASSSTSVTIGGSNFAAGDTVTFGGIPATGVVVVSPLTITCNTPFGGLIGPVDVSVVDVSLAFGTLAAGFTYQNNASVVTLGSIRLQAQQRTDLVTNDFITTPEWNSYINESYWELYDILVQKFGDDYYVATPYTYTTGLNTQLYPLPPDFYKLLGAEVALNPQDPNSWITLRKFEFIQRNLWNYPNVYTLYGVTNLRYRLNGNNLMLVPNTQAGQTVRIWYVPRLNQLVNDIDTVDGVSGWQEYIIVDAAIKALTKQETDAQVFIMQKQALLKRIEEAAENRDIGEPETVSDSKMRNFGWSDGGNNGSGTMGGW